MISFNTVGRDELLALTKVRAGEVKLGQTLNTNPDAKYQVIGIAESLGVRANHGVGGTETAWPAFLGAFVNLQDNRHLRGSDIHVAGYFSEDFPFTEDIGTLRQQVEELDQALSEKVEGLVRAGKVPLLIGGGHNNAFPILKGCSLALDSAIQVVNMDAHADFRPMEGRHSGNGFTYAKHAGYLGKYQVLGLKRSYAPEGMLSALEQAGAQAVFMEDLGEENARSEAIAAALATSGAPLGIEIDLDSIENILSSATNPYGLPLGMAHGLIREAAPRLCYLHLCEGAAHLADGRSFPGIGKVLAELLATYYFSAPSVGTDISLPDHNSGKSA